MKYSLNLYLLIYKMNRTEKAYFSKFAFKYEKEDSDLIFLYRLIDKHLKKEQDINLRLEQEMRKKATTKIPFSKFPKIKKELMDMLLESIHNHNKSKTIEEQYLHHFRRADTLLTKNLKEAAWKEINKGLTKAVEAEQFETAIFLQRKRYFIAAHLQDMEKLQLGMAVQKKLAKQLDEKCNLQILYDQIFRIQRSMGQDREKNLTKELQHLQHHPALQNNYTPLSKTGAYYQQAIQQVHAFILKDIRGSLACSKEMVDLFIGYPKVFNRRPATLLPTVSNLINDSLSIGIFSYYEKYKPWLEAQEFQADHIHTNHKYLIIKVNLFHSYMSNNFNHFSVVEKQYRTLKKETLDGMNMNSKAILSQLFASCFFTSGEFVHCIRCCNEFFDIAKQSEVREGHLIECELLLLAIHIEEENIDILPSLIRSFQNRFKRKNKLMSREEALLNFTKKLIQCFHSRRKVRLLAEKTIVILEQIPHDVSSLEFDFLLWLRAISNDKTYSDLIKNKNKKLVEST